MKVDPRFLTSDGPEIFTGNELLLKGALEAEGGVHLLGGYPGSPIAGFFDALALIKDLINTKGIRAVINNNEALSAAMLNGSQVLGCRGMIVIKSVGAHVAADALALGNLAGAHPDGGAIIVLGDDPWSDSTQVAADSRYICKHLYMPVIEPADAQEIKDFVDLSFKLSRRSELYAGYVLTTNLADGGGSAQCRPNQFPKFNTRQRLTLDTAAIDLDKFVLLPPRTWWQEENLTDRFARAVGAARELGMNRILYPAAGRRPVGFATSGLAGAYLIQALMELGVLGEYPILKLGMSYPLDEQLLAELAEQCERIVVVEERRGFLEEQISQAVLRGRQAGKAAGAVEVWGKTFPAGLPPLPEIRGLHPSILTERLAPLLKHVHAAGAAAPAEAQRQWDRELANIQATTKVDVGPLPARLPTFCPGCPHRDSSSLCLEIKKRFMGAEYMHRVHKREPVDLMFHGDTGCYTMLMFPPTTPLMHDYSGMGLGGGTGSGIDPFITNKQVVFMGDSTFFHSGQIAISQAIKLGQDITFIILDNRTTAMTGHQPTPGVDYDILGNPTPAQSIDEIIRGMGGGGEVSLVRVDVERRAEYGQLLERTFLADGVKVVIADKECGITRTRRRRRQERAITRRGGFLPTAEYMNINQEICQFCLTCAEATVCPGLRHVRTDYGLRMDTDLSWCVNDGSCQRAGSCSAFERVTVKRKRRPRSRVPELGLDDIPEPQKRAPGQIWRCCLVGVGGMGIGVATSILVRAGHKEGHQVLFLDKKGLAIRNGAVVSQVAYNLAAQPITAVISYGKADLLIGVDILEAARALDGGGRARMASSDRTAAVINTHKAATTNALMGMADFDPDDLEHTIRDHTRRDDYLARDISRICEEYLGSKVYANIMMLGFAFQKGLIPVSMHSMAWAIKDTIRAEFRKNLYAFNMGRRLVTQPDLFRGPPRRTNWRDVLEEKCRCTIRRYRRGQRLADALRQLTAETVHRTAAVDEQLKRDIVVRVYDLLRWGGIDYARQYADAICAVFAADSAEFGFAATRAVVHNLADAMLIKDAVFLAELSTSSEKYARDRRKYNVNPANGDSIHYRHLWHVDLAIAGRARCIELTLYDWMLKLLRDSRYLRKLLPLWHRGDRQYRDEYLRLAAEFAPASAEDYSRQLAPLAGPRCMDCTNPRCAETGCPLAASIPQWTQLAYQQRWTEAAEKLLQANNFPEITARICPAPCQDACKQGLNDYPVQIRCIEREIVDRALAQVGLIPRPPQQKTGKKVAVVGSGPAALAAAQQLARQGHDVTVFEADQKPGGLLRVGIPDFRLEKILIDRRIAQMRTEGVGFKTGLRVGRDISAAEIRRNFDAVLLATGARRQRDLDIPGRGLEGVHLAMDFLRTGCAAAGGGGTSIDAGGKTVAVIGGGLTGADCVELALKQGAAGVHQLEILPETAAAAGMTAMQGENVQRHWSVSTRQFCGNGSALASLRAVRVKWAPGPNGRAPRELPGSEFELDADLAVLAVGFDAVIEPELAEQLCLAADDAGRPVIKGFQTSAEDVFAAGDLVSGAGTVAAAIASGRKAAEKIHAYLTRPGPTTFTKVRRG